MIGIIIDRYQPKLLSDLIPTYSTLELKNCEYTEGRIECSVAIFATGNIYKMV